MIDRTYQKWFTKFHAGDFSMDNALRPDRSVEVDSDQIETLIENNQCYTTWEIADILKISKSSVENYLHQHGCVHHFDVWFPHKLNDKHILDSISACDPLFKCNENLPF